METLLMCLSTILSPKERKKLLDKIPPRKGIKLYKVVTCFEHLREPHYFGPYRSFEFKEGVMDADQKEVYTSSNCKSYTSGFHFYKSRASAKRLASFSCIRRVIEVDVKKSWITEIGKEAGDVVYVAKRAKFPKVKKYKKVG